MNKGTVVRMTMGASVNTPNCIGEVIRRVAMANFTDGSYRLPEDHENPVYVRWLNGTVGWAHRVCLAEIRGLAEAAAAMGSSSHGIERIGLEGRAMSYVNRGDTYETTVCEENGRLFLCSWGAWYEDVEQKHCEEENVVRCGWCSAFTPIEQDQDWRDVVCESCGNKVSGS